MTSRHKLTRAKAVIDAERRSLFTIYATARLRHFVQQARAFMPPDALEEQCTPKRFRAFLSQNSFQHSHADAYFRPRQRRPAAVNYIGTATIDVAGRRRHILLRRE